MADIQNRYTQIIETIFTERYRKGVPKLPFEREDLVRAAHALGIKLPKNLGDVLYSFRYRIQLPESIVRKAPAGYHWIIRPAGRSRYAFVLTQQIEIIPSRVLVETKIPDATPGVITKYALTDEQSLLANFPN